MHFSTLLLPFYLLGLAACSPANGLNSGNPIARGLDPDLQSAVDSAGLRLVDGDSSVKIRSDTTVNQPSVHERSLQRRETADFSPGRSYTRRFVKTLVINGVSVILSTWFDSAMTLYVQLVPAFPNSGISVRAAVEDSETHYKTQVVEIFWDEINYWRSTRNHAWQFDDLLKFVW
ncbi:hypothetical protein PTT_02466 [Pyrenophora teres f. teres 0-1]|uniref:Uncharacterized protein n=1 Tax=Pyrenophora teres f. teres (strain 0-1) TaxID=861557 RepID=E3RDL4_PYRTT|nr:hypothetical protein PTT_02466 [Pyrenophora teres f. teres 0-1]KAE8849606.1 hypothetical protein PTNB85_00022 [Pyrenophora teres f. teres]KAE8852367.1 hypothetical protein HRS9122_02654 [Pyrenophora teres f. teres]